MSVIINGIRGVASTGGDLSGSLISPVVVGLRNISISDVAPTHDQSLVFNSASNKIEFKTVSGSGGAGGISSVYTTGSLTGSGTPQNPVALKSDISLTSVSASFSGTFIGDGSGLTGVQQDLSGYATLAGLSGSFAKSSDVSSSLSQYATTSSLSDYLTTASAASTYLAIADLTSSARSAFTSGSNIEISAGQISLKASPTVTDLVVLGNLTVSGTTTSVNSTNLEITDKYILIASGAADANALHGAGIQFGSVPSEDARITYDAVNDEMEIYPAISSSAIKGALTGPSANLTGSGTILGISSSNILTGSNLSTYPFKLQQYGVSGSSGSYRGLAIGADYFGTRLEALNASGSTGGSFYINQQGNGSTFLYGTFYNNATTYMQYTSYVAYATNYRFVIGSSVAAADQSKLHVFAASGTAGAILVPTGSMMMQSGNLNVSGTVTATSYSNVPYDVAGEYNATMASGTVIMSYIAPRPFTMESLSQFTGSGAPTLVVAKNGTNVTYPSSVATNDLITVRVSVTGSAAATYFTIKGKL